MSKSIKLEEDKSKVFKFHFNLFKISSTALSSGFSCLFSMELEIVFSNHFIDECL